MPILYKLTDEARERVNNGSLILISPEVDLLTPIEYAIFRRAFDASGLKSTGFGGAFNGVSTCLESSKICVNSLDVKRASEYVAQQRQRILSALELGFGNYVSEEDRELLKTQKPCFEDKRVHEFRVDLHSAHLHSKLNRHDPYRHDPYRLLPPPEGSYYNSYDFSPEAY